jgi:hypothetical protein
MESSLPENLLDLVKQGFSGAVVAVALLGFLYFRLSNRGAGPKRQIARLFVFFLTACLLLVGWLAWLEHGKVQSRFDVATDPTSIYRGADFQVDYSVFDVDLSKWMPVNEDERLKVKRSEAIVTRRDFARKLSAAPKNYEYEFWTTGVGIDPISLQSWPGASYAPKGESEDTPRKKLYVLTVPTQDLPEGSPFPLATQFQFWNGFQGKDGDDFRARIQYPTRAVSVVIHFPKAKHVSTSPDVWLTDRDGKDRLQKLSELNQPLLSTDSHGQQVAFWAGLDVPGDRLIMFEWKWTDAQNDRP